MHRVGKVAGRASKGRDLDRHGAGPAPAGSLCEDVCVRCFRKFEENSRQRNRRGAQRKQEVPRAPCCSPLQPCQAPDTDTWSSHDPQNKCPQGPGRRGPAAPLGVVESACWSGGFRRTWDRPSRWEPLQVGCGGWQDEAWEAVRGQLGWDFTRGFKTL